MKKPNDSALAFFKTAIPITLPLSSISGPPLLPGFTAASDCIKLNPPIVRNPLTFPLVTV